MKKGLSLVVDTDIIRSMSREGIDDPERHPGPMCRDFINGLVDKCHKMVISEKLWEEYKRNIPKDAKKRLERVIKLKNKKEMLDDIAKPDWEKGLMRAGFDAKDIPWVILASQTTDKIFITREKHPPNAIEAAKQTAGVEVISLEEAYRRFVLEWDS